MMNRTQLKLEYMVALFQRIVQNRLKTLFENYSLEAKKKTNSFHYFVPRSESLELKENQ